MNSPSSNGNHLRSYLPFPLEMETCSCPICSCSRANSLFEFDQFGFPVRTVECLQCGFVFANPRPTETYMKAFYEKYFWFFFEGLQKINARYIRRQRLKEWATLRTARCEPYIFEGAKLLDVGSGAGLFLDSMRRAFPSTTLAGIEPDPKMVNYCRDQLGLEVHQGFFDSYSCEREFDLITVFHVLEHLFDFTSFFRFLRTHLKPGGLVVVEAPDIAGDWNNIYMMHFAHLHFFSQRTVSALFVRNGFQVVHIGSLQNDLDESNLFLVARMIDADRVSDLRLDPQESARIGRKFHGLRENRSFRILRAWVRLGYFAIRG